MVRSSPLPPLLPQLTLEDREGGRRPAPGTRLRKSAPLALPVLPEPVDRDVVFAMTRLTAGGRLVSKEMLTSLGWPVGERVGFTIRDQLIVINRDPAGSRAVREPSFVLLPMQVRRACRMQVGDRVLLAALPRRQRLIVHPPSTLAAMTESSYESVVGGEVRLQHRRFARRSSRLPG